jgi:ribosomal-protein-alanine N-acetyltransferase
MRKADQVSIETERLVLRLPRRGDETPLTRFYTDNRAFLQPWSPTFAEELFSQRGWRDRIDATHAEYRSGRGLRLLMASKSRAEIVGVVNFTSITSFPSYLCNLGYSLGQTWQGQGLMAEALVAAIRYVFQELDLHRIEANYMPRNQRSARVLQKLGFRIEGEAKDYLLIDGRWEDHVRTSLTNEAWRPGRGS